MVCDIQVDGGEEEQERVVISNDYPSDVRTLWTTREILHDLRIALMGISDGAGL
jgi:hypothetical protein